MSQPDIVNLLSAGSGIDVRSLAQSLVDAERAPRQALIERDLQRSEAQISGYAALKFSLSELRTAFQGLNDRSDFSSLTVSNSQSAAVTVRASAEAESGSFGIEVTALAQPQRNASNGFATVDTAINAGEGFDLAFDRGADVQLITVTEDTPQGVVDAINASDTGLSAQLIDTGAETDPWRIVVQGASGAAESFTLEASPALAALDFGAQGSGSMLQAAANASLSVNGLEVTRGSNSIDDLLPGVTLELRGLTEGEAVASLNRDVAGLRERVEALVVAYNDFEEVIAVLGDRGSEVEEFGGALAGEGMLNRIRSQVRGFIVNDSSTAGDSIRAGRDVGLSFDREGVLTLDTSRLDAALAGHFAEVVAMFSGNTDNQSVFSPAPGGLAGDANNALDRMLRATGSIAAQERATSEQVSRHETDLARLEERMELVLQRYLRQFSAMEAIVGQTNSLRDNLTSTFDGLLATYTQGR